jgi:hypothetical protein
MTYDVGLWSTLRDELKASGRSEVAAYHCGGCEGNDPVQTGRKFIIVRWVSVLCILLG